MERRLTKDKSCANCGKEFDQRSFAQNTCSGTCKIEWQKRLNAKRGQLEQKYEPLKMQIEVNRNNLFNKTIPDLISIAEYTCNQYVRERDKGQPCISCGKYRKLQAGHYYPAGKHSCVRFYEWNINGQCEECNCGKDGNVKCYRPRLREKIGPILLMNLDNTVKRYKRTGWKWERLALIKIIQEYKEKIKTL